MFQVFMILDFLKSSNKLLVLVALGKMTFTVHCISRICHDRTKPQQSITEYSQVAEII